MQPVPEILHRDAIITSTQSHIQNQLQRKHEELQQLIMKQQEELQLVSEQLHLAQRGMLPVVSSTQVDPQLTSRQPIRTHPHQMDKIDNTSSTHRTVLRLMDSSSTVNNNEQQTFIEQPSVNSTSICHTNENPVNTPVLITTKANPIDQLPQVHSSQEFQTSKALANVDDTNQTIMSPATPASISCTIGSIKFTSASK